MSHGFRTVSLCILFLLASLLPPSGAAQAPAAAKPDAKVQGTGVIEGMVLKDATGEPLRGARLALHAGSLTAFQEGGYEAVTDETGKFSFKSLPKGTYMLSVSRAGYVTQDYGGRPGGLRMLGRGGTPITLAEGQHMRDLQFRMVTGGVITGRVTDRYGDPIAGAGVSARRPGTTRSAFLDTDGTAETNDLGEYRIYGLVAGEYLVVASPSGGGGLMGLAMRMAAGNRRAQSEGGQQEAAGETYYPGVTDATRAARLQVEVGQEIPGIDIAIVPVPVYSVRGEVTIPTGVKPDQVRLMMFRMDGSMGEGGTTTAKPDGSFEISGVPSGTYRLMAMGLNVAEGAGAGQYIAQQEVIVSSGDVEGVNVTLGGGADVSGKLRIEGKSEVPRQGSIQLQTRQQPQFGGGFARVKEDGSFEIKGVAPGTYTVKATAGAEQELYYVKAVRLSGQDVREALDVSSGGVVGLDVVLGADGGTVSGRVLNEESLPAPGAQVLLVPTEDQRAELDSKFGQADQLGRFLIRGVRPGEYKLVALEEVNLDEQFGKSEGEMAKSYRDQRVAVRVTASSQSTVDVTLTRRKK